MNDMEGNPCNSNGWDAETFVSSTEGNQLGTWDQSGVRDFARDGGPAEGAVNTGHAGMKRNGIPFAGTNVAAINAYSVPYSQM